MKTKFSWYLNTFPEVSDEVWKTGTLTVDANVLLDLYRYHDDTRESILNALENFAPRIWLSYQVATEFFVNRRGVVASSSKTFQDAASAVDELQKAVDATTAKLRGFRLVPRPTIDTLNVSFGNALTVARESLKSVSDKYPNYSLSDPILHRLLNLFDKKVGTRPSKDEEAQILKEAEQRFETKTPPGYMDSAKEADRKYGDFLFWSQVIFQATDTKSPFIIVTSEQKEDWWERKSGKTLGPRLELLEEFFERTGQQVCIYQTDHFIELAAEYAGTSVEVGVVEDIQEVNAQRFRRNRANAPAVHVGQTAFVEDVGANLGLLEIVLLREVYAMTGSGRFEPNLLEVPRISVSVIETPESCPPIEARAATGTTFDFNVHIRTVEKDVQLPIGRYVIEYEAVCANKAPSDAPEDQTPADSS